jgi:ADP-heptose:LPS heptosyltransferase
LNGPKGLPSSGPRLQRFLHRRRFYPQLARIVAGKLVRREPRDRIFVALMGGVGDLVNAFPSLETLSARAPVELATGAHPYRTVAEASPHLARVHAPFVYKPIRRHHRRLIERVLAPFYARVILLDNAERRWWARGRHIAATYAELCGVPAPAAGRIYLSDAHRAAAERYARAQGLEAFIYVAQVIRARRPFRSWPLGHYHALYERLRHAFDLPIVVDTTGSDETAIPPYCRPLDRLDILVAAALIGRARLFVGPDSGLAHIAGALSVPTVSIHLGYPAASCRALGPTVRLVEQREPFDDPANTTPETVFDAIAEARLAA